MSHENTYPWIWDRQQGSRPLLVNLGGGGGGGDSKEGWRAGAPEVEKMGRYLRESTPHPPFPPWQTQKWMMN